MNWTNYRNISGKGSGILAAGLACLLSTSVLHAENSAGAHPAAAYEVQQDAPVTMTGKVFDSNGDPLIGVTVIVKGTTRGATTGTDGSYSVRVTPGETLVFNYIGYETSEVEVTSQPNINVTMDADTLAIDEVVVVGYGEQRKVNLTGAVSVVDKAALESRPVINAIEAIQGTVPGLIIQQDTSEPGTNPSINIRGLNTMNDNSPMVIIDGIEGSLANVAVGTIESISVLKDAASTAIYGSRASNGIILVTTSKGNSDRNEISYDFNFGWQNPTALPKVLDSWQYAELYNEAQINSGNAPLFSPQEIINFRNNGPNYKWLDEIYHTGPSQQHALSISGGNSKTTYMLSGSYLDQSSMWVGPDYGLTRYSARMNLSHQVKDYLKIAATGSFTRNDLNEPSKLHDQIVRQAVRMPPWYPTKDENGDWTTPSGSNSNSLARLWDGGFIRDVRDDLNGTFKADLKLVKGLTLSGMFGGRLTSLNRHNQSQAINYNMAGAGDAVNTMTKRREQTLKLTTDIIMNYTATFGKHSLNAMAGYSYEGQQYRWMSTSRTNLEDMKYLEFGDETQGDNVANSSNGNDWSLYSVFGRVNYNYDERYLFEFNIRNDWSSKFKKGNNSALFPSFSLGWRISEEDFFEAAKQYVPNLKLRGSWGLVGNNRIDNYQYQSNVKVNQSYMFGNQLVNTSVFDIANPDIMWETTRMLDIGLDVGLLKNSLTISFDYFQNMTRSILVDLPVPYLFDPSGALIQNASKVKTWGWELAVGYRVRTGKVNHNFSANISDSKNEVVDNKGLVDITSGDFASIIKEGYALNSYYGYQWDGFFQNVDEVAAGPAPSGITPKPGDIRYVDQNGDGEIKADDDRVVIGNRFPRYTFGITYGFNWKGVDFSMFWQGVAKRQVWLSGVATQAFANNFEGPLFDYHLDRWTASNTGGSYPRLTMGAESTNNTYRSDFWLENGAYIRLKNVQLGYTIPAKFTRKIKIEHLRVYTSVQNALTFSKMRGGWDPEVSQNNASVYPVARIVSLGLNVKF